MSLCKPAVLLLFLATLAGADEVIRIDGTRSQGTISLDDSGHLRFVSKGIPVPATAIRSYHFDAASTAPFRVGAGHCVLLRGGGRLTGRLLDRNADAFVLKTPWCERMTIPQKALAGLTQVPGQQTWFDDGLTSDAKAWKVTGKPTFEKGIRLADAGQSATYVLPRPLNEGRFSVNFTDEHPSGARWYVEAEFQDRKTLRIIVAGKDGFEISGLDGTARSVARTAGPNRLTVRFSRRSCAVLCDDDVLWHNLKKGVPGPLRQVRLVCGDKTGAIKGAVTWSDFALVAAADVVKRPPGDPAQDGILLANGDQLFGEIRDIDRRSVVIRLPNGPKTIAWSRIQGCFFRGAAVPAKAPDGERVRLYLHAPFGGEPDWLDGSLTKLDAKVVTLRHRTLGDIVLERGRVKEIRLLGKMTP